MLKILKALPHRLRGHFDMGICVVCELSVLTLVKEIKKIPFESCQIFESANTRKIFYQQIPLFQLLVSVGAIDIERNTMHEARRTTPCYLICDLRLTSCMQLYITNTKLDV